jgi:hypothetical protein
MSSTSFLPSRLKSLSDQALIESTKAAVRTERSATTVVLHHFIEVENRRLYADRHSSLFAWAREELRYSEGAAQRRIDSSRLLRRHPQIEEQIESGQLTLTQLFYARQFFRQEKKHGKPYSLERECEVLTDIEDQSTRETLRYLMERSSAPEKLDPKIGPRPKKNGKTELRLILNEETMNDLHRIKELWSHAIPDGDLTEIIARMAKVTLEKIDPLKKAERAAQRREKRAAQRMANQDVSKKQQDRSLSADQRVAMRKTKQATHSDSSASYKNSAAASVSDVATSATASEPPAAAATSDASTSVLDAVPTPVPSPALAPATAASATANSTAGAGGVPRSLPVTMSTEIFEGIDPVTGERQISLPHLWPSRYISADVKHAVWLRDEGQCTYVDHDGKRCCSRHQLEFEHIIPFALGGENSVDNIRLLCRCHNSHMADRTFGRRLMNQKLRLRRESVL